MENNLLIGTVKNSMQLEINLAENFYHIPKAVVAENMENVEYVALYFSEKTFAKEECIRFYGKVREVKLVKRGEITSLPTRDPEKLYYKYEIEDWKELETPILRKGCGIYAKAYSTLEKLLASAKLADVIDVETAAIRKNHREFSEKQLAEIKVTKDPVGAKLLAKRINEALGRERVTAVQITRFLLNEGYLKIEIDEQTSEENRVPSSMGEGIGIQNFWELNKYYREYSKNYYSEAAQRFIIANLERIVKIPLEDAYKNH